MIADFGQQQWSCTNFWLSDRTLRSRDRILEFWQELVKICAAANNLTSGYILACQAGTTSRYSTGETPSHKSRAGCAVSPLGVYISERQHIYEDLNESSSASPGGSQQLEIPPSPISKRAANLFRWYFTRRGDFNVRQDSIIRLYFCQTPTICKSANNWVSANIWKTPTFCNPPIFWKMPIFCNPPIFSWDANIFMRRQIFWESANIFMRRQYFKIPPTFYIRADNLWICLIFVAANIYVYFQYLLMHLSVLQYFWRNCFGLRFKIYIVVMIIWSIVIIINFVLTL